MARSYHTSWYITWLCYSHPLFPQLHTRAFVGCLITHQCLVSQIKWIHWPRYIDGHSSPSISSTAEDHWEPYRSLLSSQIVRHAMQGCISIPCSLVVLTCFLIALSDVSFIFTQFKIQINAILTTKKEIVTNKPSIFKAVNSIRDKNHNAEPLRLEVYPELRIIKYSWF